MKRSRVGHGGDGLSRYGE